MSDSSAPAGGPIGVTAAESLSHELERLREREAYYVDLLEQAHRRTEKMRALTLALGRLSASDTLSREGIDAALAEILQVSCDELGVRRAGVWLLDHSATRLRCVSLVSDGLVAEPVPGELLASSAPAYFAALTRARVLAAHDARQDLRTAELLASYLEPHGITSMLDAPIRAFGALVGVVCHEHLGQQRVWTAEDQAFAAGAGDLVALAVMTERRDQAEALAAAGTARLRYLVESLPVAVYSFHPHSPVLDYVSPQIEALTGRPAESWAGPEGLRRWLAIVHPDDEERVRARMLLAAGEREADSAAEYRIRHTDGSWRWLQDTFRVVRNAEGSPLGMQGVLHDVTEIVRARRERDEQRRQLAELVEHTDVMALHLDGQGRVTFVNKSAARLLGAEAADLIGRDWLESCVPADQREALRNAVWDGLRGQPFARVNENDVVDSAGRRRRIRWTNTLVRDADGQIAGMACLGLDLTERLQLEGQLQERQKLEGLGRLAAGVAHDFNNLLTALMGAADLLDMELPPGHGARGTLEVIRQSGERARHLTRSLLGFARRRPVTLATFPLDRLVKESQQAMRTLLGAQITLTADLRAGDACIRAGESSMHQVLLNLVANARDAMPDGGRLHIASEVVFLDAERAERLGLLAPGAYVVLRVRDTGLGMDEHVVGRVFEPFFTTKAEGRGTGLGLATCYGLVRQAGGNIMVESGPAAGSTFIIHLPRVDARAADEIAASDAMARLRAVPAALDGGGPTVLLVDDDPLVLAVLATGLGRLGWRVEPFGSAREALKRLALAAEVGIVVTDQHMPEIGGQALARAARERRPNVRAVLLTGSDLQDPQGEFDLILEKPISASELAHHLLSLVGTE